jgi:hypothetical protein
MQQICKVLGEGFVMGLEYLFYLAPNVVAPFLVKIMPVLEKLCTEKNISFPVAAPFCIKLDHNQQAFTNC